MTCHESRSSVAFRLGSLVQFDCFASATSSAFFSFMLNQTPQTLGSPTKNWTDLKNVRYTESSSQPVAQYNGVIGLKSLIAATQFMAAQSEWQRNQE